MITEQKKLEFQLQQARDEKNQVLIKSMAEYFRTGEVRKSTVAQLLDYDNCIHNLQQRIYDAADKR